MTIALIKTKPFQPHKRSASEDARQLLLKGFISNLSWSAAVHSIATTLLDCEYDNLLSPNLYFTQTLNLRAAFEQIGLLSWSQWVEWVEAAILVKNYQTSYPAYAKQVIDAVSYVRVLGQDLSKLSLERAYLQLQNSTQYSQRNAAPNQQVPTARLRRVSAPCGQANKQPINMTHLVTKNKTQQQSAIELAKSQRQIRQLKQSLQLFKSAFITLDKRAKSKLAAREALSKKLLRYLSLVSHSRKQLKIENYHLLIGFSVLFTTSILQLIF